MKYILDTHAFIWWHENPTFLSKKVLDLCEDATNELYLSIASIWEMQIKIQLGKMQLNATLQETITVQQAVNNIQILPITPAHIFTLEFLPPIHKDPFDRKRHLKTKSNAPSHSQIVKILHYVTSHSPSRAT